MTQGDVVFYLREIHGHWTTSTVSSDKLGELAAANLIEVQAGSAGVVRLTSAGRDRKLAGRSRYKTSLSLWRVPETKARARRHGPVTKPRPLV